RVEGIDGGLTNLQRERALQVISAGDAGVESADILPFPVVAGREVDAGELLPASVHGGEIEDPVGQRLRSSRYLASWRGEHLKHHRLEIRARARREIGRSRASGVAREDNLSGAPAIVEEGVVELEVRVQETVDLELVPGRLDVETAKE